MMKRTGILCLTLLYLSTALGIGLNIHYCFGRVASVEINQSAKNCRLQQLTRLPDCCKSKHLDLKVKDSHQFSATKTVLLLPVTALPVRMFAAPGASVKTLALQSPVYRGPPDVSSGTVPVFLINCTFRI